MEHIMDSNNIAHTSLPTMPLNSVSGLGCLNVLPQPVYLIDKDLRLIEKNSEGELAIKRHLVGVIANKLHFNNPKNTIQVLQLINEMEVSSEGDKKRLILRCIDGVFRVYTLIKHSSIDSDFLLTIQDEMLSDEARIYSLAKAFSLTPSETKVLSFMVVGNKPKEIAFEMNVSLCTVRSHLRTLYAKMNVRDYNDALKEAIRLLV